MQIRPKGAPPLEENALSRISERDTAGSAILVNRARVEVASTAYIWSFRGKNGRTIPHRFSPGTNPSVLLPFGLSDRIQKFNAFWNTIFPGSKRLMMADGSWFGDNTDVRAAAADELWHGGFLRMGGGSLSSDPEPLKLTLDGVFFVDGGFAGPNQLGSWEQTLAAAEAHLACAALAREARRNVTAPAQFFVEIQRLTDQTDESRLPPPPPRPFVESGSPDTEPIRKRERQMVGRQVLGMRKSMGDEAALASIEAWADALVPKFHKL